MNIQEAPLETSGSFDANCDANADADADAVDSVAEHSVFSDLSNPSLVASFLQKTAPDKPVHPGMPKLQEVVRPLSFFEFWPGYLFYIPVVFQWLWLSMWHRGGSLPLIANPSIPLSGMVGEAKSDIYSIATGVARDKIAPWIVLEGGAYSTDGLGKAVQQLQSSGLDFPLVAKPDMGCRGAGVQTLSNHAELARYLEVFPETGRIVLQKLVPYEAEAGVFYVRYPGSKTGEIISLTLKYPPYVTGDGVSTLRQLIEQDPRAGQLKHLYLRRHSEQLSDVLPKGQPFRLAFTGSHSRGCIFRDGREYITRELVESFDQVSDHLTEFYYGRFDIRFRDIDTLMTGRHYYILEVNGASSEAAHIWDCRSSLAEAFRVLLFQYRTLFRLGAINRRRGFSPPSLAELFKAWRREKRLVRHYPETE